MKDTITREDVDIANEMCVDFALKCDFSDPVRVAGCLKYYEKVRDNEHAKGEIQKERAKELLVKGVSPYAVLEDFNLSEKALFELVCEVESTGHLIYGI